ncbi:replication factor C large subunit [Candidatus Woesearchaeota archaeon]|nr:replication factor C large subunit [Candidatus Woesearchaeota archaeon]
MNSINRQEFVPWIRKYQPTSTKDVVGQDNSISAIRNFIKNFKTQRKKAILIYGSSGVGKTCSVYALANELNLEIIEVNASDFRNAELINQTIGQASKQMSLFMKQKIILVDEVDGLSGTKDRGGIQAIISIIESTSFPIICTATNPYDQKLSSLRNKCELAEFSSLNYLIIYEKLSDICKKEGVKFQEHDLKSLARRADGDLRAAINDLQGLVQNKNELEKSDMEQLSERDKKESIIDALVRIFKIKDPKIASMAFNNVEEDTDQLFLWIDENLPKEYTKPEDLARAYNMLSRADVFRGRISRWQHWRFLVYINDLLTAGIAVSKDEKNKEFVSYGPTQRLLKIWRANMKYQQRKAIAEKIASKTHTSVKDTIKSTLPYVQYIMKKNKSSRVKLGEFFELDKEEVEWMSG